MVPVYCAATLFAGCAVAPRPQPSAGGSELALTAIGLVGVPYRHGGDDPASGLDCSGLVRFAAYGALGIVLPRQAEAISRIGAEVAESQLQSGDLVFFNTLDRPYSHVGVYLGDDRFVHAPAQRGFVRIERLSQPYWRTRFNGARRLDPVGETNVPEAATAAAAAPVRAKDPFAATQP